MLLLALSALEGRLKAADDVECLACARLTAGFSTDGSGKELPTGMTRVTVLGDTGAPTLGGVLIETAEHTDPR